MLSYDFFVLVDTDGGYLSNYIDLSFTTDIRHARLYESKETAQNTATEADLTVMAVTLVVASLPNAE